MNDAQRPRLGELLVERGLLSQDALDRALAEQRATGLPLGNILVRDGLVPSHAVAMALADQQGAPLTTEFGYATGHGGALPPRPRLVPEPAPAPEQDAALELRAELEQVQAALAAERAAAAAAAAKADELRDRLAVLEAERGQLGATLATARAEAQSEREAAAAAQAAVEQELAGHVRAYSPEQHVLFLLHEGRYALIERRGRPPEAGATVELSGHRRYRVGRLGPSPFPGAHEACAYLEPLL